MRRHAGQPLGDRAADEARRGAFRQRAGPPVRLDADMDEGQRHIRQQRQHHQHEQYAGKSRRHDHRQQGEDDRHAVRPALEQTQRAGHQAAPVLDGQRGGQRRTGGERGEQGKRAER